MNQIKKLALGTATAITTLSLFAQTAFAEIITVKPGGNFANLASGNMTLPKIVSLVLQILLVFASLVFFVMLLVGGIRWILSGGDKTNTQNARSQITAALIGLVIVFSAWIIAGLIGTIFHIDIFNLELPTL